MTTLEMALSLWQRGLSVIPVPRPRPGAVAGQAGDGKVPSLAWKPYQTRRPTEDELCAWFATDQNLAIVCGAVSGVVAVDADSPEAVAWMVKHLPATPWQTKTSRGFHAFYRHPGAVVSNRARLETRDGRLALDVRGDGGYVIAPGSVHASGHVYRMAGNWSAPRERVPYFWPGWLVRPERPSARRQCNASFERPTGDVIERARRYLAAIPSPIIGQGSDNATLYAAARLVRGFELGSADAVALLSEWAPTFDREWLEVKVEHALKYGDEPIGGLR